MVNLFKKGFSILKKIILVLSVYFIVISLFSFFINKDKVNLQVKNDPIEKNRQEIYKVINDKELNKTKEGKLTIALYRATMCGMIGEACTNNPNDADKNYDKSIFGFITKLIVLPYANPPASGVYWAYSGLQSAGFIPKTYAAEGIGFAAIKPFSNLWKIFRDLSYMLLVIVLIAIGFMVMFRMKMNPQTVISVESALPKIVISLILITFSFAIAGFLIDLMYILIAIIISVLSNNNTYYDASKYANEYLTASPGKIYSSLYPKIGIINLGNGLVSLTGISIQIILRTFVSIITGIWLFPWSINIINAGIDAIVRGIAHTEIVGNNIAFSESILTPAWRWGLALPLGLILGFFLVPQLIIGLLVWFTIVYLFFRLVFTLINSYLKIFLYIIFAPLLLLFEAIPTGKSVFSWWFKSLFAELLNFPLLITFLIVGNIIQTTITSGAQVWQPPFLVKIDPSTYSILLGMMLLLLIPDLMKLVKELLGVKELPINFGLGTFFGGASAVAGGGMGILSQYGSIALAASYIPGLSSFMDAFKQGKGFKEAWQNIRHRPATPSGEGKPDQNLTEKG